MIKYKYTNIQLLRVFTIYVFFLINLILLFKNSSMVFITSNEWIVFFILNLSIGLLLYIKKPQDNLLIKKHFKYLIHTYWVGVFILIVGLLTIFFLAPSVMLYGIFVFIRLIIGIIYFFSERELKW